MPGLNFVKMDLHVHTPASKCYKSPGDNPQQLVDAAIAKGMKAIAITDHNTADWVDLMKTAARETDLTIFPGVEISMGAGFHILAIFDPVRNQKEIENFLGAIDIEADSYGKQDALCHKSPLQVVKIIHERGGLAILPHIDYHKGAYYQQVEIDSNTGEIRRVPKECVKFFNDIPYDAVECINGKLPEKFDNNHGFKRFPSFYQASDNPDIDDSSKHSRAGIGVSYTWFNVEIFNLEGLRQCFVDPEVRIRLVSQFKLHQYPQIQIMVAGPNGFFFNPRFYFHKGLNCVIGGKGVGKSLVIEFLRFALGQAPENVDLEKDHLGKLHKRLSENNSVEVVYRLANGTQYKIVRTYKGKRKIGEKEVPDSTVECFNLDSGEKFTGDIAKMFPVLAYSQTEVIKIAENKDAQLKLIDTFIDTSTFERSIEQFRNRLLENDQKLSAALIAKSHLESIDKELETLKAKIKEIDQTLKDPIFDSMKSAEEKKRFIENSKDLLQNYSKLIRDCTFGIDKAGSIDTVIERGKDLTIDEIVDTTGEMHLCINLTLDELIDDLDRKEREFKKILSDWLPEFSRVSKEYDDFLDAAGGDKKSQETKRKTFEDEKTEYEKEAAKYRATMADLKDIEQEREILLNSLEREYEKYYTARKAKYDQLSLASGGKLELTIEHAASREKYTSRLIELLKGGQNAPGVPIRRQIANKVHPRKFVELVIQRNFQALKEESDLAGSWSQRVIEKLWSLDNFSDLLALQHDFYPTDIPSIKFCKPSGIFEELSELSVGQKCTALLIIALSDGDTPVLIDQPEDALDIVSVWEDIAMKLRRGKGSRQFILTTHNSSIGVSADTDQFIILEEAGGDRGKVLRSGSIDHDEIRVDVIKRLEGGPIPYNLRALKYNVQSTK